MFPFDYSIKHINFVTKEGKEHVIFFRYSWRKGINEVLRFDEECDGIKITDAYPSCWGAIKRSAPVIWWELQKHFNRCKEICQLMLTGKWHHR
jgi:hypothetical protein